MLELVVSGLSEDLICVFLLTYLLLPFQSVVVIDTGKFSLEGADNAGIVHKVTSILAQNGLSIERMETSDDLAPHGGTTLFRMAGIAHAYEPVAAGFDVEKTKAELEALGDDLNCDIALTDITTGDNDVEGALP